jgi:hypothetical protein
MNKAGKSLLSCLTSIGVKRETAVIKGESGCWLLNKREQQAFIEFSWQGNEIW